MSGCKRVQTASVSNRTNNAFAPRKYIKNKSLVRNGD